MTGEALLRHRPYKDLSLQQLRSFCEVCRTGGYAAAARGLLLTTPAVWEQLKALERHFGLTLLERHGSGVRPTLHVASRLLQLTRPLLAGSGLDFRFPASTRRNPPRTPDRRFEPARPGARDQPGAVSIPSQISGRSRRDQLHRRSRDRIDGP